MCCKNNSYILTSKSGKVHSKLEYTYITNAFLPVQHISMAWMFILCRYKSTTPKLITLKMQIIFFAVNCALLKIFQPKFVQVHPKEISRAS
jgi:hypothetical protein